MRNGWIPAARDTGSVTSPMVHVFSSMPISLVRSSTDIIMVFLTPRHGAGGDRYNRLRVLEGLEREESSAVVDLLWSQ